MSGHLPAIPPREATRATFHALAADDCADDPRLFARFVRRDRAALRVRRAEEKPTRPQYRVAKQ